MGFRVVAFGLAIACTAACACNALTGIGDLAVGPDDASARDASSDAPIIAPPTDAGAEAAPSIDAGPLPLCPSDANRCIPGIPTGWDGPFLAYSGDRFPVTPDCPAALPHVDDENIGTPQGSINCADCRCGSPKNQVCNVGLIPFADTVCTPPSSDPVDLTMCQTAADPGNPGSGMTATLVNGGFCDTFVNTKTPSDVTWPKVLRLCSRDDDFLANGCTAGQLCVPVGAAPYLQKTCIRQMHADATCPAPWTNKNTTFNNLADDRDCTTDGCTCDTPIKSTCTAMVKIYSASTTCTGTGTLTKAPSTTCSAATATTSAKLIPATIQIAGGFCGSGGTPTAVGGVAGGDDVNTICCEP